jgi:hypothetical protein
MPRGRQFFPFFVALCAGDAVLGLCARNRRAENEPAAESLLKFYWIGSFRGLMLGQNSWFGPTGDFQPRPQESQCVHEQFWEQLADLDRQETARRAGCRYLAESDSFTIFLLNTEYVVDPVRRTIYVRGDPQSDPAAGYSQQLCILAYLVNARDLPPAGQFVSAERLDPGGFFFRGSHRLATEDLAHAFGSDPQLLHETGRLLQAVPRAFGDASIELLVLPRIPVTLIVWAADEEFGARASILFDRHATRQLPLDVLFAAAALTIRVVVSIVKTLI